MISKKTNLFIVIGISVILIITASVARVREIYSGQNNDKQQAKVVQIKKPLKTSENFYEEKSQIVIDKNTVKVAEPYITAKSYLVGDISSDSIILEKNINMVLPVASMSKLITAIAAVDTISSTTLITISAEDRNVANEGDSLKEGEKFTVAELLEPLLINSSNVAAEALSSSAAQRNDFLELMSSYAWEIGMPSTFFADPTGLSAQNVSTAKDFFALAKYLFKSRSSILEITNHASTQISTTTEHGDYVFTSTHPFAGQDNFIGGKTGHTSAALDTMISIFSINSRPIVFIVIGSNNRRTDTARLVEMFNKKGI